MCRYRYGYGIGKSAFSKCINTKHFCKPFRGGYVKCRLKSDTHQTITLSRFVRHFFQSLPRRREHCAAAIHLITRSIYYKNNDVDVTMNLTSNQIISTEKLLSIYLRRFV